MRLAALALAAVTLLIADTAAAQSQSQRGRAQREHEQASGEDKQDQPRLAPLRRAAAAGPCPFVKILYDAARYVEVPADNLSASAVGFTGELQGVASDCAYRDADPITLNVVSRFDLGRGPQAQGEQRTYRYWIAVTERNRAVLAKEYFDLPVDFQGERTATVEQAQTIVIPRAEATTSGDNFEVLVGFDVTPQMVELNRSGSRFRVNAGTTPPAATPPAQ